MASRCCTTSASSAWFYYENTHADASTGSTTVPVGLASFVGDFTSIRRFVDRDHKNVVSWHEYVAVGHYAAHQVSDVLVDRASVLVGGADVLGGGTDV